MKFKTKNGSQTNKKYFNKINTNAIFIVTKNQTCKKQNFDTNGFLEDPKLTQKQCDSRQKIQGYKPNN